MEISENIDVVKTVFKNRFNIIFKEYCKKQEDFVKLPSLKKAYGQGESAFSIKTLQRYLKGDFPEKDQNFYDIVYKFSQAFGVTIQELTNSDYDDDKFISKIIMKKNAGLGDGSFKNYENSLNESISIKYELKAGHYVNFGWRNKKMKGFIGVNYYDQNSKKIVGFPIIEIKLSNIGNEIIYINTPKIDFKYPQLNIVKNDKKGIMGIGFTESFERNKEVLKPEAKENFSLSGLIMQGIVEAFINDNIERIYIESKDGFSKNVSKDQIENVKHYFKYFFSDKKWVEELQKEELSLKE